jgi:hypothetical protein
MVGGKTFAYDFAAENAQGATIYYDIISDNTVEVTYREKVHSGIYAVYIETGYEGDFVIPETVYHNGTTYTVTRIGTWAFSKNESITSLTIPKSITEISFEGGDGGQTPKNFTGCPNLTSVYISDISAWCGINFGGTVRRYWSDGCNPLMNGARLYLNGALVEDLIIPEGVTSITNCAFYNCNQITSVTLPDGLTSIGTYAFYGCNQINSVTFPNSLESIGNYAFYCDNLLTINSKIEFPFDCYAFKENTQRNGTLYIPEGTMNKYIRFDGWRQFLNIVEKDDGGEEQPDLNATFSISGSLVVGEPQQVHVSIINYGGIFADNISCYAYMEGDSRGNAQWTENVTIGKSERKDIYFWYTPIKAGKVAFEIESASGEFELMGSGPVIQAVPSNNIQFADVEVKRICVENWDTSGDGELSYAEAAAVTELGAVFEDNTSITTFDEFRFFTGVTEIPYYAFYGCSNLSVITLPDNLTTIKSYAFCNCSSLSAIELPISLVYLYDDAFRSCNSLTSVTIPKNVYAESSKIYCSNTFSKCKNLTEIIVDPENPYLESIDNVLYTKDHKYIKQYPAGKREAEYIIPEGVKNLIATFAGCEHLTSVKIPESVTFVNGNVFEGCTGLTEIEIPQNVEFAGFDFIWGCTNITKVISHIMEPEDVDSRTFEITEGVFPATLYVPAGTKSLYEQCEGWNLFQSIVEIGDNIVFADATVKSICVSRWDTDLDGELSYEEAAAVTDLDGAFSSYECSFVESFNELQYFTGLTSLGSYDLYEMRSLRSIVIPRGIEDIEADAFAYMWCLESISVDAANTYYDSRDNCNALIETATNKLIKGTSETIIPDDVTIIGEGAFYDSHWNGSLPDGLIEIEDYAFEWCTDLESLSIPASVTYIGEDAFHLCNLQSISVESGNEVYDSRNNCNALIETSTNTLLLGTGSTVIPTSVTAIGNSAFEGCRAVTAIVVPNNVTSIGKRAFSGSNFTSIILPEHLVSIEENALSLCYELTAITIPAGVKSIGNYAFYADKEIEEIVLPQGLEAIGNGAFSYCDKLARVVIPATVETIGENAFDSSMALTTVEVGMQEPIGIDASVFPNRANATLYVPFGSKSDYESADYWKEFASIVEMAEVVEDSYIAFVDEAFKAVCLAHWDTTTDGELSYEEAAAVTSLEDAFDDDIASEITSLNDLQYFTGLTSISWEQLSGCYQLSSIVIPKNVSSIDSPLSQYFPFESISVDPENTVFDSRNDCNAIIETATNKLVVGSSNTIIPATVTAIGNYAFYFSDIQSITIPSSVKSIGQGAFTACSSLQGISLSEGLESIASMAFSVCRNVTTILVPSTVTSIGDNAFLNCGFAGLSVASGNTVYDSRNDCNAIIETATNTLIKGCNITVIPASVRRIEHDAFYACEGLTNMEIPEGVNSIGTKAFGWCSNLASVTIPSTITSIETEAFAVSSKLTSVTIYKATPLSITDRTFPYRGNATLFVPAGTKSLYENASYWAQFKEIVEMEARNEQTLAITSIPVLTYGAEAYTLPQMTNEGLALEWNVDNEAVAVSSANVLTIIGAGTAIVTAIQEGDEDYEPFSREFTLTVNKAALTITANDCTKEEGEENPEFTVSYSGFVNEEDATVLITQPSISTTATVSSQAGTYPIAVSGAEAANYDITYVNGTLTVLPVLAVSDRLYAENLTLHSGEQQTIALKLDNETTLIACEFYLQLPDGFSIEKDEDDYLVADIVSSRSNRHSFEATDEGNGLYHFLCYSGQNRAFKGNSGDFITLSIVADDDVEPGSYTAVLKDIIFSDENKVEVNFANSTFDITVANYTPGDVNDDGKINVMDIVEIVSKIMGSPSDNFILDAADIDGNGTVNVMDLVNVVEMIMTMVSQTPAMTLVDRVVPYSGLELGKANANTITMTVPDAWNHIAAQFIVSLTGNAVLTDVISDKAHQSEYTRLDDGRYMVMVYSSSNASFRSDSPIQLLISGSGNALIEEVVFVDTDKEPVAYDSAMLNTTGIISIGSAFDQPTDIYSVNGKLIKKDATSTRGLAKGVYIVNNEKVIVK